MRILFRADASLQIGSGHVSRCLTLAQGLKARGAQVTFASRAHKGNLISSIQEAGFEVWTLPEPSGLAVKPDLLHSAWLGATQKEDVRQVIQNINDPFDWIIVDHYALDSTWEDLIKPHCLRLMVIDDLADRNHSCELLLDQNAYLNAQTRYDGKLSRNCRTLLGPQYALLREEFVASRAQASPRTGKVKRVLVSYGGVDASNETAKAVKVLAALPVDFFEQAHVVVGTNNPHKDEVRKLIGENPRFTFHENTSRLAELMAQADLALGAGGTMTWERCSIGLPALITILSENQRQMSQDGEKLGFQKTVGWYKEIDEASLERAIRGTIQDSGSVQKMSRIGWQTVDAKGTERVMEQLLK